MLANQGIRSVALHWRKGDTLALSHHTNTLEEATEASMPTWSS